MEHKVSPARLSALLETAGVDVQLPESARKTEISGLCYDSRKAAPGDLFFAFHGSLQDGASYAVEALGKGAVGVVSQAAAPEGFPGLWIRVPHGRRALALMARELYRRAVENLLLTGASGTNGKTTTCLLFDHLLRMSGFITALVGTIEYRIADQVLPAVNTTPESVDLYQLWEQLRQAGGRHATMEVSSHALALGRVHGMRFHTAVFTNLTRDHLDFHKTMEAYFAAKQALFTGQDAPPPAWAIINADDEWGARLTLAPETVVMRYGEAEKANLRATHIQPDIEGLRFRIHWQGKSWDAASPMVGRMNVHNTLASIGAGLSYGIEMDRMVAAIAQAPPVPGRFERISRGQPFLVAVDYAHTPDALRNTILAARQLGQGRVITLFGCGGDRDREKRPLMGQAAGELSDYVVLTSDNPRTEDPLDIINDALVGLRRTDTPHRIEVDRAQAIRIAIAEARPGDAVLLAGKGHETYQVTKQGVIAFDDREVAGKVLDEFGYGKEARA